MIDYRVTVVLRLEKRINELEDKLVEMINDPFMVKTKVI